jgi:hypothetical protein
LLLCQWEEDLHELDRGRSDGDDPDRREDAEQSGNTIFTPVLAAASSARCRRFVRSVSEWTRSDCATLVPNLSV